MIPILTPAESRALDKASADRGVTVAALMENAGRAAARAALALTRGAYGARAVVVSGKGNNGGDGLVACRHLQRWGMGATAVLLAAPDDLRGAAATNLQALTDSGGRAVRYSPARLDRELRRADVVVDAIFGTGFHGRPEGDHAAAIRSVNDSGVPVVAVDVPSGVNAESGAVDGDAVRARVTVTFGALKPGLVFFPGAGFTGDVRVVDIGFPPDLVRSDLGLVERGDVAAMLPARAPESHKRSAGMVVVLAGSRAMTGAAILCTGAAYRAGAGLVTLAVPEGILPVVEGALTEATFLPLPENAEGAVTWDGYGALMERLEGAGAVAAGPGLGRHPDTVGLLHRLIADSPAPIVLDADGLNAFEGEAALLTERRSEAVLTPHAGELSRLTGMPAAEIVTDRVTSARKAAAEFGCAVLLKGTRTVVAEPGGWARVNPTGGPFLATGGTGDVLTGAVAALVARGLRPADAAVAAAFAHGRAGAIAADELGEGTLASDVSRRLPEALLELMGTTR
jgi:ADP-dependent NAD(P)H-hydrate dehydratase / NAD(P)H-hydrate epimerase